MEYPKDPKFWDQFLGAFLRLTGADLLYQWNIPFSSDCARERYVALASESNQFIHL